MGCDWNRVRGSHHVCARGDARRIERGDVCSMNTYVIRGLLPRVGRAGAGDPCGIWNLGFRAERERRNVIRSPWCARAKATKVEGVDGRTDRSENRVHIRRKEDCVRRATVINVQTRKMGRKFFVGGNWKMNGTKSEIGDIVAFLKTGPLDPDVGTYYGTCCARNVSRKHDTRRPLLQFFLSHSRITIVEL